MSPIIRECQHRGIEYFILYTGQHHSYEVERTFFGGLELPEPKYSLDVGSARQAEQTCRIMTGIEKILIDEQPDIVLVQGDTNTVLAGALAASRLHIRTGHVEAGLRSFDRTMPEEINRIVADHISDYLFAPTETARKNLLGEGIEERRICVTGNTIVDAVFQNREISEKKSTVLEKLGIRPREYFLAASYRHENINSPDRLRNIIHAFEDIYDALSVPIIFPVNPRTQEIISKFSLSLKGTEILLPVDFLDFMQLESQARLVLTDSGGIQESSCILGVPCVTLHDNTERPETVGVGANILAGTNREKILSSSREMVSRSPVWINPYGDGTAAKTIVTLCNGLPGRLHQPMHC